MVSLRAVSVAAAGLMILSGCSSGGEPGPAPQPSGSAPASTGAAPDTTTPSPPPPGGVAVSPGGVTTAVGAPADSTEDDYFQACHAAKTWMDEQGGDPRSQVEPYLAVLQSRPEVGPATFGRPWSELTPGQQSAVIVAVEAAADAMCG